MILYKNNYKLKYKKMKIKIIFNYLFWSFVLACFFGLIFIMAVHTYIDLKSEAYIYSDIKDLPDAQVALVLGALVNSEGELSDILKDRVDTALELYDAKKVQKFLLSGDHGRYTYDEVNAMKDYLLEKGIPKEDIFLDHAGFDTYDSIYRAKEIFEVESMIIVTQKFHLPRAIYIARSLGLENYGIIADKHKYLKAVYNERREFLAQIKAFYNVIFHSKPEFLGDLIPITGDSSLSWDE